MLKLSTINQLTEGILEEAPGEENKKVLANELVIYAKMFMIAEARGVREALDYYFGTHDDGEYLEFRTAVVKPETPAYELMKRMGLTMMEGDDGKG